MYRPPAFAIDDLPALHAFIRENPFATVAIAVAASGGVQFAYAPVALDTRLGTFGTVHFHLARNNVLVSLLDGAKTKLSLMGANAYVSPDWYDTKTRVPTWNYMAVEGEGVAERLDDAGLRRLLDDISAQEEQKLLPKTPWTVGKLAPEKLAVQLAAIVGFSVRLENLLGKFKLSQNVPRADNDGVIAGLEARGDATSLAVAKAMRAARSA